LFNSEVNSDDGRYGYFPRKMVPERKRVVEKRGKGNLWLTVADFVIEISFCILVRRNSSSPLALQHFLFYRG